MNALFSIVSDVCAYSGLHAAPVSEAEMLGEILRTTAFVLMALVLLAGGLAAVLLS